jgi:PP-loop superfamily ATP-utilizing enzyme
MKKCNRCILSEDFPNIKFNKFGICNYCELWDKKWADFDYEKSEKQLLKIIEKAKSKKRKFDCLIPFSGGRDSSYVLYLCKAKYNLNPLAVTFNNNFMSDYALKNITNLVNALGVDHIMASYKPSILNKFYRAMIKDSGEFCSICTAGINYVTITYQKIYNIPLVIMGTSTRVDEQSPFEVTCTHPVYVKKVLMKNGIQESEIDDFLIKRQYELPAKDKIKMKLLDSDYATINMPDYIEWDNQKIQKNLDDKLKWETPDIKADHIDCKFASIKYYLKNRQIPHFIFKQQKYSQLIRDEQMSRESALIKLEEHIANEDVEPDEFQDFLNFFNLKREDILKNKKSHLDYVDKRDLILKEDLLFKILATPWKVYKMLKNF